MDTVLFGGITVKTALIVIVGLAVLASVLKALTKKKATEPEHLVEKRCSNCRWVGKVSKFNTKCPKCSKALA